MVTGKIEFEDIKINDVIALTEKAALCRIANEGEEELWIPLSTMRSNDAEEIYRDMGETTIGVHDWFAKQKGLV